MARQGINRSTSYQGFEESDRTTAGIRLVYSDVWLWPAIPALRWGTVDNVHYQQLIKVTLWEDNYATRLMPKKKSPPPSDEQIITQWLHGKSPQSQRAYRRDIADFLAYTGKTLHLVTLEDVQSWNDHLYQNRKKPATIARKLSAIKSVLAFGARVSLLEGNVAAPIKGPAVKNELAERILTEEEVRDAIALEPNPRNQLLLRLLYESGARVSELSGLKWRDIKPKGQRGQVTLFGKGGKTRTVALRESLYQDMLDYRGKEKADAYVFPGDGTGVGLHQNQIRNIVKASGIRAGVDPRVSPHWLRHAHASHSLDRGAPLQLIQATLGHASVTTTSRYLHARPGDSSSLYLPD